jgi:hypothetical protein
VLTNNTGAFAIDGDYTCTPDSQVYLYGVGGNPGAGNNSAAGLPCYSRQLPKRGHLLFGLLGLDE